MADWIRPDSLVAQVKTIWDIARASAVRGVNLAHVCPSRLTELQIVASEQGGESRATYGEPVIRFLSPTLMREFGKGFSISALNCMRVFTCPTPYLLPIGHALRDLFIAQSDDIASFYARGGRVDLAMVQQVAAQWCRRSP